MLLERAGEAEHVIDIQIHKPVEHVMKDVINGALKYGRGSGESKEHDQVLQVSKRGGFKGN